ncbi:MAG: right-handed parallel beta-helix repeat-containing protein [candidate division KSB1 bacterium]|nr:right-handed parallel beta-helix repeat-containing protein [candidate division KSB1 bacterium]MDZ7335010.1 right-handed parallel beta-helix repeat-containing protein [candidate division KSB1 bacterium]MDZ7358112.1 right-handed parallel beta-helix repeat-containing protein [candidate division KSB1 bacterium]MDZ7400181.1 right-handed parallel beta-helix repeat-containing protein [candidate division KSB1 bacterium]
MKFLVPKLILLILFSHMDCSAPQEENSGQVVGPNTAILALGDYQKIVYVSKSAASDQQNDGSKSHPWASIQLALSRINDTSPDKRYAILVAEGVYAGETIQMKQYVDLFGGFDPSSWQRDIFRFRTVLSGRDSNRVIIAADSARLDGFVISGGQFCGKGAGVLCAGVSPVITNNVFTMNKSLAPRPWNPKYRHEIGHDGGAIYCENRAAPMIAHNLFVNNATEVGRGAAIAFHSHCQGRIQNNVFISNQSGIADPMRSSDGGAVSIFDWSSPIIEGNIFLNNQALNKNDAGGLFVALWSSPMIRRNLFVGNECTDDGGALFVGGQEHRYDRPLDELPGPDQFFVTIAENTFIGNSNPSRNSGALRFTMEARGEFRDNFTAHNNGVYFQRCEATISNNIILDNFLLVETKTGLHPCTVKDNLIWGDFDVQAKAILSDNQMLLNSSQKFPSRSDDGAHWIATSSRFDRTMYLTTFYFPNAHLRPNELKHRVIKIGDRWGVIRDNDTQTVSVWGDFSGQVELIVLPTIQKD